MVACGSDVLAESKGDVSEVRNRTGPHAVWGSLFWDPLWVWWRLQEQLGGKMEKREFFGMGSRLKQVHAGFQRL